MHYILFCKDFYNIPEGVSSKKFWGQALRPPFSSALSVRKYHFGTFLLIYWSDYIASKIFQFLTGLVHLCHPPPPPKSHSAVYSFELEKPFTTAKFSQWTLSDPENKQHLWFLVIVIVARTFTTFQRGLAQKVFLGPSLQTPMFPLLYPSNIFAATLYSNQGKGL